MKEIISESFKDGYTSKKDVPFEQIKNLPMKEVISQFFKDGYISKKESVVSFEQVKNLVQNLVQNVKSNNAENYYLFGNLSPQGGNINLIKMHEKHFDETHMTYEGVKVVTLIEPLDYDRIQPYDRQLPFYCPVRYEDLVVNGRNSDFKIFKTNPICERVITSFSEGVDVNDFWKTISFKFILSKKDSKKLYDEMISLYNF